ncbi:MAG: MCE family protein [Schwartzia sp.]|nr:MCE family protein [Schwartzia sp. (in: firmicutes)]MBO6235301.1 MCE family protein [Schwartzia sp. (in: firmicutes)]
MSNEVKVGAFTVIGLALLAAMLIGLSGVKLFGPSHYTLYATFPEVIGLNPSAEVRFAGVPAGKVLNVETEGMHVLVTMLVNDDIRIPHASRITVSASGFLGEKYVNILPARDTGMYLEEGDRVAGTPEENMDAMLAKMSVLIEQAHDMMNGINSVVNNPELNSSLVSAAVNLKDITGNVRDMTGAFSRMAVHNEGEINRMVRELSVMSVSLAGAAQEVEGLVKGFSGDGEAAANLRATVANIASTSARIDNMAKSLEGVVTDPQTAEDLKAVLHNTRGVTEKADKMMSGLGGGITPGVEVMYSGQESNWRANFDVTANLSEKSLFRIGVNDIGEGNRFNLQAGQKMGALTARAGIIDGEVGLGLDADAGKYFRFSLDAYDLNNIRLRPRASVRFGKGTYLFGQVDDVNDGDRRATYVGVRQEF